MAQKVSKLWDGSKDIVLANWHLGLTSFGGPPVHFQIFHRRFVDKYGWIDEQVFQELFGICQALPGPASTKMLFCINSIHGGGFASGILAFILWCLPGALGMYGLSLGIARVGDTLPDPVYALISGLNAATVGVIALAAVQLAEKAITDKLTRLLVFLGGAAGMLHSSLWYFPVLMASAGVVTIIWDFRIPHKAVSWFRTKKSIQSRPGDENREGEHAVGEVPSPSVLPMPATVGQVQLRRLNLNVESTTSSRTEETVPPRSPAWKQILTWKMGASIIIFFFASFITVMVVRGLHRPSPRGFALFANLYLAGTIIFGGGPVVIPLLRQYIVDEGWVSPRDFLLGLAIIQSFPGPNFNFAVYLGALSVSHTPVPSAAGALIAFLGIFIPGLLTVSGVLGFWHTIRSKPWLMSLVRGVNAAAVGVVYTAVYRLWQIGYVDGVHGHGTALGIDPWWVAITATSFVGGKWFGLGAPYAILLGGVMGLLWFAVVKA